MANNVQVGDQVKAHYQSGTYLGIVKEDRGERYLIEVLAVHKHPLQGDLHNMNQTEDVFFHERKALAFHEKMNVKKPAVHLFDGEIPDYVDSLKQSVKSYREKLEKEASAYNKKAIEVLNNLEEKVYKRLIY